MIRDRNKVHLSDIYPLMEGRLYCRPGETFYSTLSQNGYAHIEIQELWAILELVVTYPQAPLEENEANLHSMDYDLTKHRVIDHVE